MRCLTCGEYESRTITHTPPCPCGAVEHTYCCNCDYGLCCSDC